MIIHFVAIDFYFEKYEDDVSQEQRGVKNPHLLLSAVNEPRQTFNKVELYPTVFEKAACLIRGLIKNHPFHNANKRTAVLAMLMFLELNDYHVHPRGNQVIHFARGISINSPSVPRIVRTIKKWCHQVPPSDKANARWKWYKLVSDFFER